jgi:hypothetical protein
VTERRLVLGVSGSRLGGTVEQNHQAFELLSNWQPTEVHHGCCAGVDETVHHWLRQNMPHVRLVGHLPLVPTLRVELDCDVLRDARGYLDRNRDVVDESSALLALPPGPEREYLRSGTWAAVRYARRRGKPVHVLLPDGTKEVTS